MNAKKAKQLRKMIYKTGSRHERIDYIDAPNELANRTRKPTRIALGKRGVYLVLKKNLI